jgi:hypothetical protein
MAKRSNALSGNGGRGGGPGSRALGSPTQYFTGRPSDRVRPGGADQLGQAMGNKATDAGGKTLRNPATPMIAGSFVRPGQPGLGNAVALNVGGGGPGAGRTVQHCGTQATHGPVAPGKPTPARDILREFGPDVPGRK